MKISNCIVEKYCGLRRNLIENLILKELKYSYKIEIPNKHTLYIYTKSEECFYKYKAKEDEIISADRIDNSQFISDDFLDLVISKKDELPLDLSRFAFSKDRLRESFREGLYFKSVKFSYNDEKQKIIGDWEFFSNIVKVELNEEGYLKGISVIKKERINI